MQKFNSLTATVIPLNRADIDTDAIIPKQYLKSIKRSGFGANLFDAWRYLDEGDLNTDPATRRINADFVLNQSRYRSAQILLAGANFGCGSSREHAVWALMDYGIRVVIAPSFADIFYTNSFKNGLLAIAIEPALVDTWFGEIEAGVLECVTVDLAAQTVQPQMGRAVTFSIDGFRKHCLLEGLDEIALTLRHAEKIKVFEAQRRAKMPWLFTLRAAKQNSSGG